MKIDLRSLLEPPAALQRTRDGGPHMGKVFLVGAGPGDPDLLTLRAARLLEHADVVVYDNLVSPGVMAMINPAAELIYVGKKRDNHSLPQPDINRLLVSLARQKRTVIRLKGGDPFIFGRGGEELEVLADAAIPFEVVPGITAGSGATCYAGIPLTHRDYAQSCVFVTGHLKQGSADLDWDNLSRPRQTVVIYMGLSALQSIGDNLVRHGMPASMPVALIEKGSTPDQKVLVSTLRDIAAEARERQMQSPCLLVVGEVVSLRQKLDWFPAPAITSLPSVLASCDAPRQIPQPQPAK